MNHDHKGFTLIELMLAMTFISALLVAIAMTTIQISNIYTKGITLREVNQAGRTLSEELQRNIASSSPFNVVATDQDGTDSKFIVKNEDGGRLCLGKYTYLWNLGKAIAGTDGAVVYNKYSDVVNTGDNQIRFVKVADPAGDLCRHPATMPSKTNANDLLTSGDRDLVVHKFSIAKTSDVVDTSQAIYAISFTLGTNDREQLTTSNQSCRPPSDNIGDEDYCSVNTFDIIARAGNRSEGQ